MHSINDYKPVLHEDYEIVIAALTSGKRERVLVRMLNHRPEEAFPLLDVAKGPFVLSKEGITGFSLQGEFYIVRINDNGYVEMRCGDQGWRTPDIFPSQLLLLNEPW